MKKATNNELRILRNRLKAQGRCACVAAPKSKRMKKLDLHTLETLRARLKEPNLRYPSPKGREFEQGENYAFAKIEQLLAEAIEQAGGEAGMAEQLAGYTETEQSCRGCMGPCGRCDEPDTAEPEIPWYALPDWVRYVAMDEDGQWYAYDCKPICVEEQWALDKMKSEYNAYRTGIIPFTAPDWSTSLRQRPEKDQSPRPESAQNNQ